MCCLCRTADLTLEPVLREKKPHQFHVGVGVGVEGQSSNPVRSDLRASTFGTTRLLARIIS